MKQKKDGPKEMKCLKCGKWTQDDNLLITPKGSFCEDCYY